MRNLYVPAGTYGKVYAPDDVLVVLRSSPVALFSSTTLAPGTTAPAWSSTVPLSVPTGPWAQTTAIVATRKKVMTRLKNSRGIFPYPPDFLPASPAKSLRVG